MNTSISRITTTASDTGKEVRLERVSNVGLLTSDDLIVVSQYKIDKELPKRHGVSINDARPEFVMLAQQFAAKYSRFDLVPLEAILMYIGHIVETNIDNPEAVPLMPFGVRRDNCRYLTIKNPCFAGEPFDVTFDVEHPPEHIYNSKSGNGVTKFFSAHRRLEEMEDQKLIDEYESDSNPEELEVELLGPNEVVVPVVITNTSYLDNEGNVKFGPQYGSKHAAGFDFMADCPEGPIEIEPMGIQLIPTGIKAAIPEGYEMQIRPRSGLAFKHGISLVNTPGTIDADYRGEIKIIMINLGKEKFTIKHGERIAQGVINEFKVAKWQFTDTLDETTRAEGGFGHTGV